MQAWVRVLEAESQVALSAIVPVAEEAAWLARAWPPGDFHVHELGGGGVGVIFLDLHSGRSWNYDPSDPRPYLGQVWASTCKLEAAAAAAVVVRVGAVARD